MSLTIRFGRTTLHVTYGDRSGSLGEAMYGPIPAAPSAPAAARSQTS